MISSAEVAVAAGADPPIDRRSLLARFDARTGFHAD
jgi:hypothetical protein